MRVGSLLCVSDLFWKKLRNKRGRKEGAPYSSREILAVFHTVSHFRALAAVLASVLRCVTQTVTFSDCGRRSHLRTAGPLNSFASARRWRLLAVAIRFLL